MFDTETGAAQLISDFDRLIVDIFADRNNRYRTRQRNVGFQKHAQALDAAGPADAGNLTAAHLFDQTVITAAGQHRPLRTELIGNQFENGVRIIVQAAHQTIVNLIFYTQIIQPFQHGIEKRG